MSIGISKPIFVIVLSLFLLMLGVIVNFINPQIFSGKSLSVYSGIVENFQQTIEIRKDGNPHETLMKENTRTTYIAQFRLGEKQINAEFPKEVLIKNGDQISVCGEEKNGKLNVLTFKNFSQNLSQNSSVWWANILAGIVFFILSVYVYFYVMKSPMLIELVVITAFTMVSFYLIYRGLVVKQAIEMLEKAA
jgi:hypothetical protein